MFYHLARNLICCFSVTLLLSSLAQVAQSQTLSITRLSGTADYALSADGHSVAFVGSSTGPTQFAIQIDGEVPSTINLTIGSDFAHVLPISIGDAGLANPLIMSRDDDYSFVFVTVPSEDAGQTLEPTAAANWMSSNSAWFAGRFGWGWQESLGEFLAVNVLIPIVGVENLANASDTTLVTGTVVVSIPIAVGIVAGGEVVLGVGNLGGSATAGGGAVAGGGVVAGGTVVSELGIGTQAVVAPGLGAGSYPGLLINGTVYVARFHEIAWQVAGRAEPIVKYGIAIVDATGKVIGWM